MRNKEPVANMKLLLILLLAGACLAYTPIAERSWVKFKHVKDPAYNSSLLPEAPNIIYAKEILINERVNQVSKMIEKSLHHYQTHLKQYTTDLTTRIKRATENWIRKETRALTSIRNVVQPSWTGHFWIKEYGLVPLH